MQVLKHRTLNLRAITPKAVNVLSIDWNVRIVVPMEFTQYYANPTICKVRSALFAQYLIPAAIVVRI